MADDGLRMIHPFWEGLDHQLKGDNPRSTSSKSGPRQKSRYHKKGSSRELRRTKEGYFKVFEGSDVSKGSVHGKFVQVPKNSLNIMDYVQYRGYPYTIIDQHNGAQYELGVSSRRESEQHSSSSTPLDSAYVGLHPQPYYSKNGKPMKDKDGKKIMVTARGGFSRFSQPDLGQGNGGDPLIRFIRNINNINTRDAYRELAHFVNNYGRETKFDPLDHSMPLPKNSQGEFTKAGNKFALNSGKSASLQNSIGSDMDESYNFIVASSMDELTKKPTGRKALNHLKDIGYTDRDILQRHIGWVPSHDQEKRLPQDQRMSYSLMKDHPNNLGFPLKSQFFKIDNQGGLVSRFAGQYIRPLSDKHGKTIGLQACDKNMNPTQKVKQQGRYSDDPFGDLVNGKNSDFADYGHTFNQNDEKGKRFARGYLNQRRGISPDVINGLMDEDLVRVSLGTPPDAQAPRKLKQIERDQSYWRQRNHKEAFIQRVGNERYQDEYKAVQEAHDSAALKMMQEEKETNVQRWGKKDYDTKMNSLKRQWVSTKKSIRGYPAYLEFAQKLPSNDKPNLMPNYQDTVGADRIMFDPARSDYKIDPDQGHRGKKVSRNSMRNYGFNVTCGKQNRDKKRELYVFEDPIDAISYLDMNRRALNRKEHPCDFLSLSGSSSKINTISNYIHHKTDSTGENYQRIHFGTDNDIHGQQAVTEYTEKARTFLPRNKVNDTFQVESAPYGKDWNDTRKHYAFGKVSPETHHKQVRYTMDEFTDRIFHDHLHSMSDEGKRRLLRINDNARHLYIDYLNRGIASGDVSNTSYFHNIKKDTQALKDGNQADSEAYDDFKQNLRTSFTPKEINRSLHRLDQRGMLWEQGQQRNLRTSSRPSESPSDTKDQGQGPFAELNGMSKKEGVHHLRKQGQDAVHRESLRKVSAERSQRRKIERAKQLRRKRDQHYDYRNGPKM